jgi:hypothetical protein
MRDPAGVEPAAAHPAVPVGSRPVAPMPEYQPRGRGRTARLLLAATPALVILGTAAFVGFVRPGYLRAPLLDQATVQSGVQSVLTDNYGLPNVTSVSCPEGQRIKPGLGFDCVAKLGTAPATVHVIIQDAAGTYLVNRPVLHP